MKDLYNKVLQTGERIRETHPIIQAVAFAMCLGLFAILGISTISSSSVKRIVFYFPSASAPAKVRTEVRYIPLAGNQDEALTLLVSEMLLGPVDPETIPLFPTNTRILRCFIRGNEAYIDLSASAEDYLGAGLDPAKSFTLFKKNVFTNFRNVAKIYVYIEGEEVYRSTPVVSVAQK